MDLSNSNRLWSAIWSQSWVIEAVLCIFHNEPDAMRPGILQLWQWQSSHPGRASRGLVAQAAAGCQVACVAVRAAASRPAIQPAASQAGSERLPATLPTSSSGDRHHWRGRGRISRCPRRIVLPAFAKAQLTPWQCFRETFRDFGMWKQLCHRTENKNHLRCEGSPVFFLSFFFWAILSALRMWSREEAFTEVFKREFTAFRLQWYSYLSCSI